VSHALVQEDLDLALLQLRSETLEKIEDALSAWISVPTATASSAARR